MIYNLGRVVPLFKGNYNAATTYGFLDVVYYDNSSFVALDTTTGNLPTDTEHWLPVALKGTTQDPTPAQMQQIISEVETYIQTNNYVQDANYQHIDVADNLTSTSSTNALSANQGRILDLLLSHKKNTFTDLTAVQKVDGYININGQIVQNSYWYHTEPIHLLKGQCLIYRGYVAFSSTVFCFNYVSSEGTFIKPITDIKSKQFSTDDYSRNNTSIFTATEECYVSVNLYIPNNSDWYLCKSAIGVLYDIWNKFKLVDSTLSSNTEFINLINNQLNTFNFVHNYYINNSGVYTYAVMDEKYHADNTYYELGDIIKIDNVSMVNNFPIIAFYDSNKTYLSKINSIPSININITSSDYPENAVYCRLAYYGVNQPTIYLGYSTSFYELENTDESLQSQIDTLSSQIDNTLINYLSEGSSLFTNGHYINYTNGTEVSNSSYSCTDYLEIPKIKQITLINCQTGNGYMAAIAFYDSNKTFISSLRSLTPTQVGTYTVEPEQVPDNTKYIRVSGGIVNTYNPKVDYTLYIKETVEQHNEDIIGLSNTDISLSDRITVLENAEETVKTIKFKCFQGNSTLAPNEVLTLPSNKVRVNSLLSVSIDGTIEQVDLGVGYTSGTSHRTYEAKWIELTQTEVKVYGYYNNGNVLEHTYSHGLTLTDNTRINIHTTLVGNNDNSTTTIRISTNDGQEWNQENTWGQGIAFVQNMNTSGNLNVELKFMPRDIDKNIWVFGDSYFSTWPKYLYRLGFSKWLRNSQPGSSPEAAYSELQHLLTLGYKPSYVVWCLGMNGATTESMVDGHYVINNNQKIYIDNVKSLCESYDIVPVFTCIPTVPTRQKTGFRTYIQNLNVRYIDMYKAVGSDEYGIWHGKPTLRGWTSGNDTVYTQIMGDGHAFVAVNDKVFDVNGNYTNYQVSAIGESNSSITVNNVVYNRDSTKDISGLLSNDGVHPTELGAKVIANSVMAEFPEISICE